MNVECPGCCGCVEKFQQKVAILRQTLRSFDAKLVTARERIVELEAAVKAKDEQHKDAAVKAMFGVAKIEDDLRKRIRELEEALRSLNDVAEKYRSMNYIAPGHTISVAVECEMNLINARNRAKALLSTKDVSHA